MTSKTAYAPSPGRRPIRISETNRSEQPIANKDPQAFPDPNSVKLDRPLDKYASFSFGPHQCFGRELALSYLTGFVKRVTSLKNIRPALGEMGTLKKIFQNGAPQYLTEDWSTFSPYASSKEALLSTSLYNSRKEKHTDIIFSFVLAWQLQFNEPDFVAN